MKILIRGAGDLATGIAWRLKAAGHDIVMTEAAVPTTVRRTVAFSRAVYEGSAEVEGLEAVLVHNMGEIGEALSSDKIAVIVDENGDIRELYKPDVLIDAIIAKCNLGTSIEDAGLVVGVGPGFTAGKDCHCVIETKRGHYLGKVIYSGSAIPNTGIPGEVGGYSSERIIRAACGGEFKALHSIGDMVEKDEVVATSGGMEIRAQMPGIIRGMLQDGVVVTPGMKCGDIDARCEKEHCYTISDKARAIGGGVLEAVDRYDKRRKDIAVVILAAGQGSRYGSNKLVEKVGGRRMFEHALEAAAFVGGRKVIVTGYDEIGEYAVLKGFTAMYNRSPEAGISVSLKLGLSSVSDTGAVLFTVADQPGITSDTLERLVHGYAVSDRGLACMGADGELGNPCIFSKKYYRELEQLTGDVGGKRVIRQHLQDLTVVEATREELEDIDWKCQLSYGDCEETRNALHFTK